MCKKTWLMISLLFCCNTQALSRSENIPLPYHAKKSPIWNLFFLASFSLKKKLPSISMGHMNESGATKLRNILNICNNVLKFVPVISMTFCFRILTSQILNLFDSLFPLLCLFCELIISSHAHNPD